MHLAAAVCPGAAGRGNPATKREAAGAGRSWGAGGRREDGPTPPHERVPMTNRGAFRPQPGGHIADFSYICNRITEKK